MKFVPRKAILALPVLLLSLAPAYALNDLWTGVNSNNWFDGGNWSLANPPTALDNARLGTVAVPNATVRINGPGATADNVFVADVAGSTADLRVHNNGTLGTTSDLDIGRNGAGTFVMTDVAQVTVGININIADQVGSTGDATLRDFSRLTAAGNLRVGTAGVGTLTIRDSAAASSGNNVNVGVLAGSNGTVDVAGNPVFFGFNLASTNNMGIGDQGTGMMTVHDGGFVLAASNGVIGNATTGVGTVIIRGESSSNVSTWQVGNNLTVGELGNAGLEVHNGGEVDVGNNLRIARLGGSVGTVLVEGTGGISGTPSVLNVTNNAFVGGDAGGPGGDGMLTIKNNGVVNVGNNMTVWGPGTGNRATLEVDSTYVLNVGGTLIFDGGRLHLLDGTDFINPAFLNNTTGATGMVADVDDDNTATISGDLSGPGNLVKTGTGTLILDEFGTYNETHINNGTFIVGNSFALGLGDVDLNAGTLRTPEGTPLQYFDLGNFNANGGTFYVQVGSNTTGVGSDEMVVSGAANLNPGSGIFVHRINNYNPANGDTITVIDTNLGTFGEFSNAPQGTQAPNDFIGLIRPFIDYGNIDPGDVDLFFAFAASFQSVAKTPNQIATAHALDQAVAAGCIVNATNILGNVPINTLRGIYDLIAPEELASIYEASFAQQMAHSLNLQHRMDDIRWGSTGFCADGFVIQDNHGYTKNDGKSVADKNPVEQVAPPNYRWGAFITGTGELTKVGQEDDNAAGYQLNNAGFTMGVDYRVTDHWAIGLSGGYSHTNGDLVNNGHLNTDGGKIGLYTTYGIGGFYVDAAASGGWNQYDTRRNAYLGLETGSTDGAEFDGMVAVGYDWKKGCWIFGPYADFEYNYVEFNSFSEDDRLFSNTSSLIPLHYPDQNQSAYRTNLGLRIAHEQVMKPGEGLTVVPEVRAAWRHDFGDNSYAIDSNFIGCTDTFTVHGPWIGSDSAVVDIGLTAYCTQQLSAYIFYQGQFGRDNYNNNAISGGMRFAF